MDVMRTAAAPMTVTEIAKAVMSAANITGATKRQRLRIEAGIRSALEGHAGKSVERVGEGVPRRWRITES
jgi:hypothetical protein